MYLFTFISSVVGFFFSGRLADDLPARACWISCALSVRGLFRRELEILSEGGVHHSLPAHGYILPLCRARGRGGGGGGHTKQRRGWRLGHVYIHSLFCSSGWTAAGASLSVGSLDANFLAASTRSPIRLISPCGT
jgi:hypothetical protein